MNKRLSILKILKDIERCYESRDFSRINALVNEAYSCLRSGGFIDNVFVDGGEVEFQEDNGTVHIRLK